MRRVQFVFVQGRRGVPPNNAELVMPMVEQMRMVVGEESFV